MHQAKILLVGGSGLLGRAFMKNAGQRSLYVLMRSTPKSLAPSVVVHQADSEVWPSHIASIKPDMLICCLGTTIKSVGGDAKAFRAVDYGLVVDCAIAAHTAGARHMIVISSVGASAQSRQLYLKTKGEMENALKALGFDRLDILRPGLLIGPRAQKRTGEAIAQAIAPLTDAVLHGALRRYRSIEGDAVARALWALTNATEEGVFEHHFDEIRILAS
jgi:uncharacterized protein YbjT (DUF2867 family)